MLQLHLGFDMGVLKAFITLEMVEKVVIEVEKEVSATRKVVLEIAGASEEGAEVKTRASASVPKVIKVENADES